MPLSSFSTIRRVTGQQGGVGGVVNVGSNTDKTWPTSGNPDDGGATPANTNYGCFNSFAGDTGWFEKTGANAGTFIAWDANVADKKKPSWAVAGPSFIELPAATAGQFVSWITTAMATSLNSTASSAAGSGATAEEDFEAGYAWRCLLQFYVDESAYQPVTTLVPEHDSASGSGGNIILHGNNAGSQWFQGKVSTRNVAGFLPGLVMSCSNLTGAETTLQLKGGASSSRANSHLRVNRFYDIGMRAKRDTSSGGNAGKVQIFVNGQLVIECTGVPVWTTVASRLVQFMGLGNEFVAISGIKLRWAPTMELMVVPDASIATAFPWRWEQNVDDGSHLRRLWPVQFVGYPCVISAYNGSPTLPTAGRINVVGGLYPGIAEVEFSGSTNDVTLSTFPAVWDGVDNGDTPFGADGYTHISLTWCIPNSGKVTLEIRKGDDTTVINSITLDDTGSGALIVDGNTILSGRTAIPAKKRWQIVASISPGTTKVTIHNLSADSIDSTLCRVFSVTNTYTAGGTIGKPLVFCNITTGFRPTHASVSVHSSYDIVLGDSWSDGACAEAYTISGVNQGTKTFTCSTMGSRNPPAGRLINVVGGANAGTYTVASSTSTTVVVVEAIPSATVAGSVDLCAPILHCSMNGVMTPFPDRDDAQGIPGAWMPTPFGMENSVLHGFHPLIHLARSGGKLTELINNVLPNCTEMPNPMALVPAFDVNDTTATTTDVLAQAQVDTLAANKETLARWIAARGGTTILLGSPNLEDQSGGNASFTGWANRFRRTTTGNVLDALLLRVADRYVPRLHPINVPAFAELLELDTSDALHLSESSGQKYTVAAFRGAKRRRTATNLNTDGSMRRLSGGARTGAVGSAIGN